MRFALLAHNLKPAPRTPPLHPVPSDRVARHAGPRALAADPSALFHHPGTQSPPAPHRHRRLHSTCVGTQPPRSVQRTGGVGRRRQIFWHVVSPQGLRHVTYVVPHSGLEPSHGRHAPILHPPFPPALVPGSCSVHASPSLPPPQKHTRHTDSHTSPPRESARRTQKVKGFRGGAAP